MGFSVNHTNKQSQAGHRDPAVPAASDADNKKAILIACGAVGCLTTLLAIATASECHSHAAQVVPSWTPSLLYGAVLWCWWAGTAMLLWQVGRRWAGLWILSWRNGPAQLAAGLGIAYAHLEALTLTVRFMVWRWPHLRDIGCDRLSFLGWDRLGIEVLLYYVVWGGWAAVHSQLARQKEALQTAELKQQLSSAHLRALQMQLEPHFLFNTLNAITTLVELGRQKEAVETLAHLNAILKSTLARTTPEKVPLAQELEVVENYLAIEQVRFPDRLRVELSIDPAALDGMVPCFLLQPIVENAIRHGISQLEEDGVIRASIKRDGGLLHLSVWDNGPGLQGKSHHAGHGIGLRNTEDRLAHFYPMNYGFSSGDRETGGFEVSVTIPYERAVA
jgi:signal transduction histidine kinase